MAGMRARAVCGSWPFFALLIAGVIGGPSLFAQGFGNDPFNAMGSTTNLTPGYDSRGGGTVLQLKVYAENDRSLLDRQSVIKLTNQTTNTVRWMTTDDKSEAFFGDMPFGHYDIEVSAVGYLTEHKELQVVSATATVNLDFVLKKDPAAFQLGFAQAAMPPKARKETKHGVSALKSGNLKQAERWLDAAYSLAPGNPDLNFLMGYLSYQRKDFPHAQNYLGLAASLNPHDVQSLTLMGRIDLQQENYPQASTILEKAVAADSNYWMAHDLLAGAYLKEKKYDDARHEAQTAIEKSKGAGSGRLVLGQALVNLGQRQEGIQALKAYLIDSPKSPTAPQVKTLIAQLETESGVSVGETLASAAHTSLAGVDPLLASPELTFSVRPWQPAGIDDSNLSIASGVTCPYDQVIEQSGKRVKELVDNVSRIAALEHLLHEQMDEIGNPITRQTRDFNYVASISEASPGALAVEEYRAEHLGMSDFPDQIASTGFAALALVFHPDMRGNFDMKCEGLSDWHGQPTWLVYFHQRDDRPANLHDYRVGSETYAVRLKGRAWITADKFQIVRIESELVNPMKPIQLLSEHQIVEYGAVPFQSHNTELWLPKTAEIYFEFRHHRYYRRHSFDHYMLFAVASEEKRKEPSAPPLQENTNPQPN
jgi:tetratricopeptide (TPR) repeat protein